MTDGKQMNTYFVMSQNALATRSWKRHGQEEKVRFGDELLLADLVLYLVLDHASCQLYLQCLEFLSSAGRGTFAQHRMAHQDIDIGAATGVGVLEEQHAHYLVNVFWPKPPEGMSSHEFLTSLSQDEHSYIFGW